MQFFLLCYFAITFTDKKHGELFPCHRKARYEINTKYRFIIIINKFYLLQIFLALDEPSLVK